MKILRLIIGLDPLSGGPAESSVAACIATQRAGYKNTFAFTHAGERGHPTSDTLSALEREGVPTRIFRCSRFFGDRAYRWGLSFSLPLWVIRRARFYDVIHVHGAWGAPTLAGLLAGWLWQKPVVMSPHESLTQFDLEGAQTRTRRLLKRAIGRMVFTLCRVLLFSSELELRDSVPWRGRAEVLVVPHPVEVARVDSANGPRPARRDHGGLTVGFLGRLHPKKNVRLLIESLGGLPPDIRLRVAGTGSSENLAALRGVAMKGSVINRVDWLGFVSAADRAAFFRTVDVLALPSQYECFGMAAAEALSHDVPVVVSARTGIAELVQRYNCGWIVSPAPKELASVFLMLAKRPDLLGAAGRAGRILCEDHLSVAAYGRSVGHVYELIGAPTGRREMATGTV